MTDKLVDQLPIRYRWLLAESQAREAKLRELMEKVVPWIDCDCGCENQKPVRHLKLIELLWLQKEAEDLPHDDTALKEYRKQVLLEAADMIKQQDVDPSFKFRMIDAIRRMAEE